MMKKFVMIKYGRWEYPADVPIRIVEIAGHFDKSIFIQSRHIHFIQSTASAQESSTVVV